IDNGGDLAYYRRNSAGVVVGPYVLDNTGTIGAGVGDDLPLLEPTISMARVTDGSSKRIYIAYVNSARTQIKYFNCASTVTVNTQCSASLLYRTGNNLATPKLGFWSMDNDALPIMWNDANNVYFDKIITSTFAAPTSVVVSTAVSINAFLTQPNYNIRVQASWLQYVPGVSSPTPTFCILASSETQTDISVGTVTLAGGTSMFVTIRLSTHVNVGFDYDMRFALGDGQEYPTKYNRNLGQASDLPMTFRLDPPTITGVSDEDYGAPNAYVSGGTSVEPTGPHQNRAVRLQGTGFMNWTGSGVTSVFPSTNTVKLEFQNASGGIEPGITVDSMTYGGSTFLTSYLDISTSVPGGKYTILLTNPSSGTAVSPPSVLGGGTF
ncbi:MAG: hypothetical protein AAB131_04365, partial [Actinomycetota bacterium]